MPIRSPTTRTGSKSALGAANNPNTSGVVSSGAGTSRSRRAHPAWRIARPGRRDHQFLEIEGLAIAPTSRRTGNKRVKARRSGTENSSGTASSWTERDWPNGDAPVANHRLRYRCLLKEPHMSRSRLSKWAKSDTVPARPGARASAALERKMIPVVLDYRGSVQPQQDGETARRRPRALAGPASDAPSQILRSRQRLAAAAALDRLGPGCDRADGPRSKSIDSIASRR